MSILGDATCYRLLQFVVSPSHRPRRRRVATHGPMDINRSTSGWLYRRFRSVEEAVSIVALQAQESQLGQSKSNSKCSKVN